jgi:hypothetical protein
VEIRIRAFDCVVAVRCECEETLRQLDGYLLPSLPRVESDADVVVEVRVGEPVVVAVQLVDAAVVGRIREFVAVHAGVVGIGGKALLLPGPTHAGKSTLVAELVARGATYFSDEYAVIDVIGAVHPYPRPLLLRKSGVQEQLPSLAEGLVARDAAPMGWVIDIRYERESEWRVQAVPQSEGLLVLLRNTPHVLAEQPRILEGLAKASGMGRCFRGMRGEAAAAAEKILELCS